LQRKKLELAAPIPLVGERPCLHNAHADTLGRRARQGKVAKKMEGRRREEGREERKRRDGVKTKAQEGHSRRVSDAVYFTALRVTQHPGRK